MGCFSTSNWLLALISTSNTFRSLIGGGASSCGGSGGGIVRANPVSVSIVVVIRKKISNKKAISAIEPALISGISLFAIENLYFYCVTEHIHVPVNLSVNLKLTSNGTFLPLQCIK